MLNEISKIKSTNYKSFITKSSWSKTALYLARYLSLFILFFLKFLPKNEQLTGSFFVFSIAWQAVRHSWKENHFWINEKKNKY